MTYNYDNLKARALSGVYATECRRIVLGYAKGTIQVLKLPCVFKSADTLESFIYGNPLSIYLNAYIAVQIPSLYLHSFIRVMTFTDTLSYTAFIRNIEHTSNIYFKVFIRVLQGKSIYFDLKSLLYSVEPFKLNAFINIIEFYDIHVNIEGVYLKGFLDLKTSFFKIYLRQSLSIKSFIYGWAYVYLKGYIFSKRYKLLSTYITGINLSSLFLNTYLVSIPYKEFSVYLHSYAIKDLHIYLSANLAYLNLIGSIYCIPFKVLYGVIKGFKGFNQTKFLYTYINKDLYKDLYITISTMKLFDLITYINTGRLYKDLVVSIKPSILKSSSVIAISLLQSVYLYAMINTYCLNSNYKVLYAYCDILFKKDLVGYVIGWDNTFYSRNIKDLSCFINTSSYEVLDYIHIRAAETYRPYAQFKINGGTLKKASKIENSFNLIGGNLVTLNTYIYGQLHSKSLVAFIQPKILPNFTTTPMYEQFKHTEQVLDINNFSAGRNPRYVNIKINSGEDGSPIYYYIKNYDKIYSLDRNKSYLWAFHIESYYYKASSRSKSSVRVSDYVNLEDYSDIDEQIKFILQKHGTLFKKDLYGFIKASLPLNCIDLYVKYSIVSRKHWFKNLNVFIQCV